MTIKCNLKAKQIILNAPVVASEIPSYKHYTVT